MRAFAVFLRLLFLSCLCAHSLAWAAPPTRAELPSALRPWVDWVLAAHPEAACPLRFDEDRRECLWPGRLVLQATALGVSFVQRVDVAAPTRMALPGGPGLWPQQLSVDNTPAMVVEADGRPVVALPAGEHRIAGWIPWPRMPDAMPIPPATGLVTLTIDGQAVASPRWRDGRLWLRERKTVAPPKETPADRLRMTVQRLLADGHPALLTTELSLTVTGSARELVAGRPVPEGFTPLRIESKLPARLEADGRLRLQVRPGTWEVRVIAHRVGEPGSPGMVSQPPPWPGEETWAFAASPTDRLVRIRGVAQVDPRRTPSPQAWHRWPTYRLTPGDELDIETLRRGNPQPDPDQLTLDRTLWLDFDGGGYTLRDQIRGQLNRTWRMSMAPAVELGRVSVDGEPQFITLENDRRGVEVRQGRLALEADARMPRDGQTLPASGWGITMQSASAELYTPPGWRVLMVGGVDAAPGAWLSAWTLFDLFFVLLSTIAVARLWGIGWAAVTLVGLALVWQEPEAPRLVWLGVMAVAALRRLVPAQARFAGTLRGLWFVAWLVLAVQALPFAVTQARLAFYPQLENTRSLPDPLASRAVQPERARELAAGKAMPQAAPSSAYRLPDARDSLAMPSPPPPAPEPIDEADPGAVVQTGPGLPDWTWRRTGLSWNGPVAPEQTLEPWLLAPATVSALRVLALVLLASLAWRMSDRERTAPASPGGNPPDGSGRPDAGRPASGGPGAEVGAATGATGATATPSAAAPVAAVLFALATVLSVQPSSARAQEPPSQALLDELARRLLEPEHAAPRAALPMMSIRIADDTAIADLQVHALQRTAVPLPVDASDDWPLSVALDGLGDEAPVLRAVDGRLWILVPEGRHLVSIRQRLTGRDVLAMPVPLRIQRVTFGADDWAISGLNAEGVPGDRIVLTRRRAAQAPDASQSAPAALEPGELPPLVRVTRTLSLGLQWRVTTEVQRLSPPGRSLTLNVPLLPGEAVTTPGIVHDDDAVRVVMAAGSRGLRWQGTLDPVSSLTLSAPASPEIVETWRLDVGPIWHMEYEGLAPIHHQDGRARWLPTWHPWPGESLVLTLSKPEGAGGRTMTIDASRLTLTPGAQQLSADLSLTLRTSQGRRHPITLPEGAQLQWVRIDGLAQPLQLDGRVLTLPLDPGERRVELRWQQPQTLAMLWRTPTVDLGVGSVNARLTVETPASRWLVWLEGPRLGPAVLFWGVLVVVVVLAVALARAGRGVLPLGLAGWLLLGIGLMQTSLFAVLPVLGWLVLLQIRGRHSAQWHPVVFNLAQLAIVVLTVFVAAVLYFAVQQSLLGWPDMQIEGNGSTWRELHWYADRSGAVLPDALLVSLPMLAYRVLMLLWALWLAFTVLGWLRWAWPRFGAGGFWRAVGWSDLRRRREQAPGVAE